MNKVFEYKIVTEIPISTDVVERQRLNKLGEEGWELVGIIGSPFFRYYFKREVEVKDLTEGSTEKKNKDGKEKSKDTSGSSD
jgi:hypothetical protein